MTESRYVFRKKTNTILAHAVDFLGGAIFRLFPKKTPINPPKSLLLVRLDHIGDVLLCTGLPKLVKEFLPGTRVLFLVASWAAPLLENNPFIDELIIYDPPWFARGKKKTSEVLNFFKLSRLLKKKKIGAAVALRGDSRENFLLWLSGIPQRVGYGITGGGFFLTHERPFKKGRHQLEHSLNLMRVFGIEDLDAPPKIYFSPEEEKISSDLFSRLGLQEGQRYIGIQVLAGTLAKLWPIERWDKFLKKLKINIPSHKPILVGMKASAEEKEMLLSDGILATGKTSLRELSILMRHFDAFIGPDSGPAHLASVLGIPTLFLYSGTNIYDEWRPLEKKDIPGHAIEILRKEVPCAPCGLTVCAVEGHPCMSKIEPEEAIIKMRKLLCLP